MISLTFGKT